MTANDRRIREVNWFPFENSTSRRLASLIRFRHGMCGAINRISQIIWPLLFCVALPMAVPAQSRPQIRLSAKVQLSQDAHGELAYLVFASHSGFPGGSEKAILHSFLPIPTGKQTMQVDVDLPPGRNAVSVHEDLNANHKLDKGFLGIPLEPVGVSNNPSARMRPPRVDDSSFRLGAKPETVIIKVDGL